MQNYNNTTNAGVRACACVQGNENSPDASRVLKFNPVVRPIEFNRVVGLKIENAWGKKL